MRYWEDIEIGEEQRFGAYEVTREEVIAFAANYDPQPFHLSDEAAQKTLFGKLCASGWHSCAMTMRMMVENMKTRPIASLGATGIDELRWLKPVFPGDVLSVKTKVLDKKASRSRPHIGYVAFLQEVFRQDGVQVMSFKSNVILRRRETGSGALTVETR